MDGAPQNIDALDFTYFKALHEMAFVPVENYPTYYYNHTS